MSNTIKKQATIVNKHGMHARPAMKFVDIANRFSSDITVLKGDEVSVDAKSIMSVMRLAATKGTTLTIVATGKDAQKAADALAELIDSGFGES